MPEFPVSYSGGGVVASFGAASGSVPVTLTTGAVNKGSYVELLSSTAYDANWIMVNLSNPSAGTRFFVDLGIGAATESVVISNLFAISRLAGSGCDSYLFPLFVPRGSRLTARVFAVGGSATIGISGHLIAGNGISGGSGASVVSTYGMATLAVFDADIDPGATPDTDSSVAQITSATVRSHNWITIAGYFGDSALAAATNWRVQLLGGAATEATIIADMQFSSESTSDMPNGNIRQFPIFIPAGTRLSAKVRSSVGTAGDRRAALLVYGC